MNKGKSEIKRTNATTDKATRAVLRMTIAEWTSTARTAKSSKTMTASPTSATTVVFPNRSSHPVR